MFILRAAAIAMAMASVFAAFLLLLLPAKSLCRQHKEARNYLAYGIV